MISPPHAQVCIRRHRGPALLHRLCQTAASLDCGIHGVPEPDSDGYQETTVHLC